MVGCAEDWSTPKPTILFGLRKVLGKEKVRSKVTWKMSRRWMGRMGQRASRQDRGSLGVRVGVAG